MHTYAGAPTVRRARYDNTGPRPVACWLQTWNTFNHTHPTVDRPKRAASYTQLTNSNRRNSSRSSLRPDRCFSTLGIPLPTSLLRPSSLKLHIIHKLHHHGAPCLCLWKPNTRTRHTDVRLCSPPKTRQVSRLCWTYVALHDRSSERHCNPTLTPRTGREGRVQDCPEG